MPDAYLYLKAISASASVSTLLVLALVALRSRRLSVVFDLASVLATAAGVLVGYFILSWKMPWPPANALERLLFVVFPIAVAVQCLAATSRPPRSVILIAQILLAAISGWVLLFGSVYVSKSPADVSMVRLISTLFICAAVLLIVWISLLQLSLRTQGFSVPLSLIFSLVTAGFIVMMAGYIKGGGTAFLFAAAIAGTIAVGKFFHQSSNLNGIIGLGAILLFGILFIGRFFGRLGNEQAIVVMVAPLAGWLAELPMLRGQKNWVRQTIRFASFAIPLISVLLLAKLRFDREFAPLLVQIPSPLP